MCFRLLAALDPPGSELEARAARHGLDVRARGPYLEVAWGDCACSLYTRHEGRGRLLALVEELLSAGHRVQLLLFTDGEPFAWEGEPAQVSLEALREHGLAALPEGAVAELHSSG
jgi:hypothetical protein